MDEARKDLPEGYAKIAAKRKEWRVEYGWILLYHDGFKAQSLVWSRREAEIEASWEHELYRIVRVRIEEVPE